MADQSNNVAYRHEYLIVSEGKHIGHGSQTMYSPDTDDDGRDQLKSDVLADLQEKHPDTSFMVIIRASKVVKYNEVKDLPNGYTLTEKV
jgi:hypothetical protein